MQYATLAGLIRGRLQDLDLTQRALSRLLARRGARTSENAISKWVRAHGSPDPARLEALLDVLGVYGGQRRAIVYRMAYAPDGVEVDPLHMPAQGSQGQP